MSKVSKEIDKVLQEKKKELLENIKKITPVKTGYLQQNWQMDEKGENGKIYNNTSYASYVNDKLHFIEIAALTTKGVKPNGTIVRNS